MRPEEAAQILGIAAHASPEERRKALDTQRTKIEQRLGLAPTEGLKVKYREALRRLDEAYETLELSEDHADLPSLRPDFSAVLVEPAKPVTVTPPQAIPEPAKPLPVEKTVATPPAPEQKVSAPKAEEKPVATVPIPPALAPVVPHLDTAPTAPTTTGDKVFNNTPTVPKTGHGRQRYAVMLGILGLLLAVAGWYWLMYLPAEAARKEKEELARQLAEANEESQKAKEAAQAQAALERQKVEAVRREKEALAKQIEQSKIAPRKTEPLQSTDASRVRMEASKGRPWENSLGMKFVPVPGTKVLFSIWDTRVKDYAAYAKANSGVDISWENPEYKGQKVTPDVNCPVVYVSWEDAKAFCAWLTKQDQAAGLLDRDQQYRLPTDEEWSVAVGLPRETGNTPKDKDGGITDVYPWGTQWPPPRGAGNFADMTALKAFSDYSGFELIEGYDDGYATTAPVGSFNANAFGLFDLSGNVWQWCEDWYDTQQKQRVFRGGSWSGGSPNTLRSSRRRSFSPGSRNSFISFRVVVEGGAGR